MSTAEQRNAYLDYLKGLFAGLPDGADIPILSFDELARNGLGWQSVAEDVQPACAVVRRKERVRKDHPDLPPGAIALTVWIVGTDPEKKGSEWTFFTGERVMTSGKQTLFQVIWCDGTEPVRSRYCLNGPDGPVMGDGTFRTAD